MDTKYYIGIPFKYGGENTKEGLDCYTFIQYVYNTEFNDDLPILKFKYSTERSCAKKYSDELFRTIERLKQNALMVFAIKQRIHVGIYLGNERMLHMTLQGSVVSRTNRWRKYMIQVLWRDCFEY